MSGIVASERQRQRIAGWALPYLEADERVQFASFALIGRMTAKGMAKEVGRSLAVAAVTLGTFYTVPRPRMMSVAVTDRRLLFFDRAPTQLLGGAPKPSMALPRVGFERSAVKRVGFTKRFTIHTAGSAESLRLQCNLGWTKDAETLAAAFGPGPST